MKNHLTDRQLLDVQFKLCPDKQAEAATAHLAGCAECRGRADALKQKFASLDLLRGDVRASEQLVAETLRQVRNEPPAERIAFPQFGWLAGAAAAVVIVLAVVYTGPIASQPASMAKVESPAAPVMQIAMQAKDTQAAEPVPEREEVVAETKPMVSKTLFASRARGFAAEAPAAQAARAIVTDGTTGATYHPPKWSSEAPPDVTIQIYPAMIEADEAAGKIEKDSGRQAQQWSMNIINQSDRPVTALITRAFGTTNWTVSVPQQAVQVITQKPDRAALSVAVKPRATQAFTCTTILPAEEGDSP